MAYSLYPVAADLAGFFADAGMTPPADLSGAVAAGIQAFERDCDRHFLAGMTIENATIGEETRAFDPAAFRSGYGSGPGAYLDFGPYGDVVDLSGVVWSPPGGPVEPLSAASDYAPAPFNAPSLGYPYTGLTLRRRGFWPGWGGSWFSGPGPSLAPALEVTGLWGFGTTIPADAWRAMLASGAILLWTSIFQKRSGGLLSWKEADVSEDYGIQPLLDVRKGWQMDIDRPASVYRRTTI